MVLFRTTIQKWQAKLVLRSACHAVVGREERAYPPVACHNKPDWMPEPPHCEPTNKPWWSGNTGGKTEIRWPDHLPKPTIPSPQPIPRNAVFPPLEYDHAYGGRLIIS